MKSISPEIPNLYIILTLQFIEESNLSSFNKEKAINGLSREIKNASLEIKKQLYYDFSTFSKPYLKNMVASRFIDHLFVWCDSLEGGEFWSLVSNARSL